MPITRATCRSDGQEEEQTAAADKVFYGVFSISDFKDAPCGQGAGLADVAGWGGSALLSGSLATRILVRYDRVGNRLAIIRFAGVAGPLLHIHLLELPLFQTIFLPWHNPV